MEITIYLGNGVLLILQRNELSPLVTEVQNRQ